MKALFRSLIAVIVATTAISCQQNIAPEEVPALVKHIKAYADNSPETRTALNGKVVEWEAGDAITVFDEDCNPLPSDELKAADIASNVADFTINGLAEDAGVYAAVYPVDATAVLSDDLDAVSTVFPNVQTAKNGSFGQGANLAVASTVSAIADLKFKNVGGLLALTVGGENISDVTSIELSANKAMAGPVKVDLNTTAAVSTSTEESDKTIKLEGSFEADGTYYFSVLPGEYTGLTIVFKREGYTATYTNPNTLTVKRNSNTKIGSISISNTKWVETSTPTPSETTSATWVAADQDYTNGVQYTSADVDSNISLAFGDGVNDGKYYDTGTGIRIYANGKVTVSASNGATISEITLTFSASGYAGSFEASTGEYSLSDATGTWKGSASSVVLTNTASSGHARIQKISVKYTGGATTTTTYSVRINDKITGGTVSSNPTTAAEGDEVTLSATPATGFEFSSWNVTNASTDAEITVTDNKFTMPAADVNVSATFNALSSRPENEFFYESFDTNAGTGGNDGQWSGSIATHDIKQDNEGWEYAAAKGADQCAKFGAGSSLGFATTPVLGVACNATLTFKAAAWNGNTENTTLKLSVIDGGIVSPATVTMTKGEWTTFTATLTGLTASSKVKFEGNAASNSRFFLDEVSIVKTGEATSVYTVTVDSNISNGSVTASPTTAIEGTTVTLKATPDDGHEFESWNVIGASVADATSETTTFTMPASNVTVSATFKATTIPDKTIAEFIAAEGVDCYLTGTVSNIVNTTYGNFDLTDESGTIYIFGCLTPNGVDKQFSTLGVEFGDKIKVHASEYVLYNGTKEAKNVVFVEIVKKATKYDVTVADGIANGTVTVDPSQAAEGQTVTITATPNSNYKVKDSSIKVTKASGGDVEVKDNKFTMPAEAVTVSAEFEKIVGDIEQVYQTARFGSAANSGTSTAYTTTFTSTTNGFSVSVANGNTNGTNWAMVKFGRKNVESVGSITTSAAIDKAVTKVVIDIDAITAANVNSITLYSGISADSCTTNEGTFNTSTGKQAVTISSPAANKFYKVEFDCKSGSGNGLVAVKTVEYYAVY